MTGSIAVSQCGHTAHTPNRPGHHGTVVARTVGTVAISCNVDTGGCQNFNLLCVLNYWPFKILPLTVVTARYLSPLHEFESRPRLVRKLPVSWS